MKKSFGFTVVVVVLALQQGPALAGGEQTFFLRSSDVMCGSEHRFLSVSDGPDGSRGAAPACGTRLVSDTRGFCDEFLCVQGPKTSPYSLDWPASDGLPFRLDASRQAAASITLDNGGGHAFGNRPPPVLVGSLKVTVVIEGREDGAELELGRGATEFLAQPGRPNTVDVAIPLDASMDGRELDGIRAVTILSGHAAGDVYIELESIPSFVVLPGEQLGG